MVHVHTTFSDGKLTPSQVAARAQGRYDVVLFADHSDLEWKYQFMVVSASVSMPSLKTHGIERYYQEIAAANKQFPGVILLPGVEVSPFYWWQGMPMLAGFTLRDWSRHLVVTGIDRPQDWGNLPLLAWGTSRFDPYAGDPGPGPYQDLIDSVRKAGGLVFWAHAGAPVERRFQEARAFTPAHGEDLIRTRDYTGFAASGPSRALALPGAWWDKALLAYCQGQREQPAWVVSENDYHAGNFPHQPATIVLAAERSRKAVLEAMRQGRMYACNADPTTLALSEFALRARGGEHAIMGETLTGAEKVQVCIRVTGQVAAGGIRLVRDGKVLRTFSGNEVSYSDSVPMGAHYYRLQVIGQGGGEIFSNPIFARR